MKKILNVLLAIALVTALSACGSAKPTQSATSGAEAPIVITIAHVEPEGRSLHQGSVLFKEYVEEKSQGRIQVNILPNGQFGGDREAVEGVILGSIQMAAAVSSVLTSYSDDFMILDLPFMFNSREANYRALDGELGAALNDVLPNYGLVGLGFNDNGLRQITNNVRPVNTPEDLKGVKMRVMESPVFVRMFNLLGANPTPMSFTEVYTALQQGTVDGQENGVGLVYESKFQEVQKYLSLTGHVFSVNAVVINKDFYEALPEDLRNIIAEGVKSGLVDGQREIEGSNDDQFIEKLKDAGMTVNEVSPENLAAFRAAMGPLYEEYREKVRTELFEMIDRANAG
ncbi:MAG: DctP family TRAP transporter solute-binding subunit [Clostridiales Family XIII bacterium]|nr:DctP family TRAP transporter solute-binding subunit [Clostridiales Family XIII bacterium]